MQKNFYQTLLTQLVVAATFVLLAAASLNLGVYPVLTRPLWLPAALVAALVYARGSRDVVGLMLGAGLFGIWRYWGTQSINSLFGNMLFTGVQVYCASYLLTKLLGPSDAANAREMHSGREIMISALVLGPVMMAIKPIIMFPILLHLGLIPNTVLWDRALDWIVADVMAFILVAPMIWVAIGKPRDWWRSRFASLVLLQSLIVVGFIGFLQLAAANERTNIEKQLSVELDSRVNLLKAQIEQLSAQIGSPQNITWLQSMPRWFELAPAPGNVLIAKEPAIYLNLSAWMRADTEQNLARTHMVLGTMADVPPTFVMSVNKSLMIAGSPRNVALWIGDPYLRALVSNTLRLFQFAFSLAAVFATLLALLSDARRRELERLVAKRTFELSENAQQLRMFKSLVDQANEAVAAAKASDADGVVELLYCNAAFEKITGYKLNELHLGDPEKGSVLTGPDTDRQQHVALLHALRAGQPKAIEMWHYRRDGAPFWAQVSAFPLFDELNKITHYAGFYRDASAKRETLERIFDEKQRAQHRLHDEQLGRMAGGIAHDVNNLLTTVTSGVDLLRLQSSDPQVLETADDIEQAIERAGELTTQLLGIAGHGAGQSLVLDVAAQLAKMQRLLRLTINPDIKVNMEVVAEEPLLVRMDPGHFTQVLMNFFVNAAQSMSKTSLVSQQITVVAKRHLQLPALGDSFVLLEPPSPPVTDVTASERAWIEISVSDNGSGIAPELMPKIIFPRFTTKATGSGLGLAGVAEIIKQQQGSLRVDSLLGHGTLMRAFFPEHKDQLLQRSADIPSFTNSARFVAPNSASAELSAAHGSGDTIGSQKRFILVVEDDPGVRSFTVSVLNNAGYTVSSCENGLDALAWLDLHHCNLVLTDLVMPKLDGYSLLDALRIRPSPPATLVMSGFSVRTDLAPTLQPLLRGVIQKPFSPARLLAAVATKLASA